VLRRASSVTVMNTEMRQAVTELGVPADRVGVLPMGVALDRIRPSGEPPARVPGRLVFVGRLVEKKGLAVLLEALRRLPADRTWSLDIVGDGPLRAELEAAARPLGDRVTFHGQRSSHELSRTLAAAEVAVFPSVRARSGDQDGLPVATLEALAAGTPVVATDLPGLSDAVVGGEAPAGVVVPSGDAAALAEAIERLLGDPATREQMGRAAVRRAEEYSMEAIGARYVTLLQAATAAGPAGDTAAGTSGQGDQR
jgi:glycosyltransferase involved in cell wall biosynthesis